MTINSIRETIAAAAPEVAGAGEVLDRVAAALTEREWQITEALVEKATTEHPISEEPVLDLAREAGLSVRPAPEPEATAPHPQAELRAEFDSLKAQMEALLEKLG